jgi:hypothetical protein
MTIAGSDAARGEPVISKVDWYKPRPDNVDTRGYATVYNDLMIAVPDRLHREAIAVLGNSDLVELRKEQAKHFGFRAEPDSVLRSLIQQSTQDIRQSQKFAANVKTRRTEYSVLEFKKAVEGQQSLIKDSNAEIKRYQEWMGRLRPYLIRSVTFRESHDAHKVGQREDFDGIIGSGNLVIYFGSSGVTSNSRFRMIRMPVVAYLPIKPRHVYTEMTLLW